MGHPCRHDSEDQDDDQDHIENEIEPDIRKQNEWEAKIYAGEERDVYEEEEDHQNNEVVEEVAKIINAKKDQNEGKGMGIKSFPEMLYILKMNI